MDGSGPHTPGFTPECAAWLAGQPEISGIGVETVGVDAAAEALNPPFPMHFQPLGADKYGVTSRKNLDRPPTPVMTLVPAQ